MVAQVLELGRWQPVSSVPVSSKDECEASLANARPCQTKRYELVSERDEFFFLCVEMNYQALCNVIV